MLYEGDLRRIREASTASAAVIIRTLTAAGISSALWGNSAAVHYGSGLCLLDIELVINDVDQERAFGILTSNGLLPSVPEGMHIVARENFSLWRAQLPSMHFRDRRRCRLHTPAYVFPPTGNPIDDALLPFVFVYSAEDVGLPRVPTHPTDGSYISVKEARASTADAVGAGCCLLPTFSRLVESEMHVILGHAQFHSPLWGQHNTQLSELAYSRNCPGGINGLARIVKPELAGFAAWFCLSLEGKADRKDWDMLQRTYCKAVRQEPTEDQQAAPIDGGSGFYSFLTRNSVYEY